MSPIPINASMGMLLSLAIALVVTPWMSARWMATSSGHHGSASKASFTKRLAPLFQRLFAPFLRARGGAARAGLGLVVAGLIAASVALPIMGLVVLKMLPFDNKSEFQVMLDMPEGTRLEKTDAVLRERAKVLEKQTEVQSLQVNLVDKSDRDDQSHVIAVRLRPEMQEIGLR